MVTDDYYANPPFLRVGDEIISYRPLSNEVAALYGEELSELSLVNQT